MANLQDIKPNKKTIKLNDGVEREVKFTLNAMAELEDKYGSVDAAFAALDAGSVRATRFILWVALKAGGNDLTEEQVGDLIDINYINDILSALDDTIKEDNPQLAEVTDPNA